MAEDDKPKNKGGRPRKHPVGTRVPTLAFRVRAGLRDKLEQSAAMAERSISEEIENRLEASFDRDHNADLGALVRDIATASEQSYDGKPWVGDKVLSSYVYTRLCIVLAARMGVPVMRPDEGHDVTFTVPDFSPPETMAVAMKDAADMAWEHETTGFKRPSFAERLAQHQATK